MKCPDPATVYRWHAGRELIAGRPIAYLPVRSGGLRVLVRDTAEKIHVIDVDASYQVIVVAGPVSLQEALDAAERVVMGISDHGSVTRLVRTLAVGMVGLASLHEQDALPCA